MHDLSQLARVEATRVGGPILLTLEFHEQSLSNASESPLPLPLLPPWPPPQPPTPPPPPPPPPPPSPPSPSPPSPSPPPPPPLSSLVRLCAVAVTPFVFRRASASFGLLLWRAGLLVLLPALASIPAQQQPQEWPSPPPPSENPLLVPQAPSVIPHGQAVTLAPPSLTSVSPANGAPTLLTPICPPSLRSRMTHLTASGPTARRGGGRRQGG